jgi:hypothetical protein
MPFLFRVSFAAALGYHCSSRSGNSQSRRDGQETNRNKQKSKQESV